MNNDPSKVNVLYGKIFPHSALQSLADEVAQFFMDAGNALAYRISKKYSFKIHLNSPVIADLMKKEGRQNVRLHLTFMNTQFARRKFAKRIKIMDKSSLPKLEKTFDARNILQVLFFSSDKYNLPSFSVFFQECPFRILTF